MEENKDKLDTKTRLDNLKKLLEEPSEELKPKRKSKGIRQRRTKGQNYTVVQHIEDEPLVEKSEYSLADFSGITELQNNFLKLYIECHFNITEVCMRMKINRQTYYRWMEEPEFAKAFEMTREYLVDMAEATIAKLVQSMDGRAAQFILKTLGKKKGYSESIDITSNGQSIVIPSINIIMPKDDLDTKE